MEIKNLFGIGALAIAAIGFGSGVAFAAGSPIEGHFVCHSMDAEDEFTIGKDFIRYVETEDGGEGSNLIWEGTVSSNDGTTVLFTVNGKKGKVSFTPDMFEVSVGGEVCYQDSNPDKYSFATSLNKDASRRNVYADPGLTKPIGEFVFGSAMPYTSITKKYIEFDVTDESQGVKDLKVYVPTADFTFINGDLPKYMLDESYAAQEGVSTQVMWSFSYADKTPENGDRVGVCKTYMPLAGGMSREIYYGGTVKDNAIIIDCTGSDYNAFDSRDFSSFEKVDTPFGICFLPYQYNGISVGTKIYEKLDL